MEESDEHDHPISLGRQEYRRRRRPSQPMVDKSQQTEITDKKKAIASVQPPAPKATHSIGDIPGTKDNYSGKEYRLSSQLQQTWMKRKHGQEMTDKSLQTDTFVEEKVEVIFIDKTLIHEERTEGVGETAPELPPSVPEVEIPTSRPTSHLTDRSQQTSCTGDWSLINMCQKEKLDKQQQTYFSEVELAITSMPGSSLNKSIQETLSIAQEGPLVEINGSLEIEVPSTEKLSNVMMTFTEGEISGEFQSLTADEATVNAELFFRENTPTQTPSPAEEISTGETATKTAKEFVDIQTLPADELSSTEPPDDTSTPLVQGAVSDEPSDQQYPQVTEMAPSQLTVEDLVPLSGEVPGKVPVLAIYTTLEDSDRSESITAEESSGEVQPPLYEGTSKEVLAEEIDIVIDQECAIDEVFEKVQPPSTEEVSVDKATVEVQPPSAEDAHEKVAPSEFLPQPTEWGTVEDMTTEILSPLAEEGTVEVSPPQTEEAPAELSHPQTEEEPVEVPSSPTEEGPAEVPPISAKEGPEEVPPLLTEEGLVEVPPAEETPTEIPPSPAEESPAEVLPPPSEEGPAEVLPPPSEEGPAEVLPPPSEEGPAEVLPPPSEEGPAEVLPPATEEAPMDLPPAATQEGPVEVLSPSTEEGSEEIIPTTTEETPAKIPPAEVQPPATADGHAEVQPPATADGHAEVQPPATADGHAEVQPLLTEEMAVEVPPPVTEEGLVEVPLPTTEEAPSGVQPAATEEGLAEVQPPATEEGPAEFQPPATEEGLAEVPSLATKESSSEVPPPPTEESPAEIQPPVISEGPPEIQPPATEEGPEEVKPPTVDKSPVEVSPPPFEEGPAEIPPLATEVGPAKIPPPAAEEGPAEVLPPVTEKAPVEGLPSPDEEGPAEVPSPPIEEGPAPAEVSPPTAGKDLAEDPSPVTEDPAEVLTEVQSPQAKKSPTEVLHSSGDSPAKEISAEFQPPSIEKAPLESLSLEEAVIPQGEEIHLDDLSVEVHLLAEKDIAGGAVGEFQAPLVEEYPAKEFTVEVQPSSFVSAPIEENPAEAQLSAVEEDSAEEASSVQPLSLAPTDEAPAEIQKLQIEKTPRAVAPAEDQPLPAEEFFPKVVSEEAAAARSPLSVGAPVEDATVEAQLTLVEESRKSLSVDIQPPPLNTTAEESPAVEQPLKPDVVPMQEFPMEKMPAEEPLIPSVKTPVDQDLLKEHRLSQGADISEKQSDSSTLKGGKKSEGTDSVPENVSGTKEDQISTFKIEGTIKIELKGSTS